MQLPVVYFPFSNATTTVQKIASLWAGIGNGLFGTINDTNELDYRQQQPLRELNGIINDMSDILNTSIPAEERNPLRQPRQNKKKGPSQVFGNY